MPKNKVSDPITDQEMAFARLVLSGTVTDRCAAGSVGLNPDSAAYIKSKPQVRAYMLDHRAAVEQQLVQQEAEGMHRFNLDREQVLARLWEIANLSPEMTRGSITGQVKALSMIVAMQNFIPDRRAGSSEKNSTTPAPAKAQIYESAWLAEQKAKTADPQPGPVPGQEEDHLEDSPTVPEPAFASAAAGEAPPNPGASQSTFANPFSPSEPPPVAPYFQIFGSVPDTRIPFFTKKNRFGRRR
jgi:hypothetical protein